MFAELKGGVKLKKAPKPVPAKKKKPAGGQMGGMAAMVAQIAADRRKRDAAVGFARTSMGRK